MFCPYVSTIGRASPLTLENGYTATQPSTEIPKPCASGNYVDEENDYTCRLCEKGKYCDHDLLTRDKVCPRGYYCNQTGIVDYQQYFCPPGYYCPDGKEKSLCTPGFYCSGYGNAKETGKCWEGYYCLPGSRIPNPRDNKQGNICPPGYYCEEGSSSPKPCPSGTYNEKTGASNQAFCQDCPIGRNCTSEATYDPKFYCPEGSYCETVKGEFKIKVCEPGYFCPLNKGFRLACTPGSYQNISSQTSCRICPAGYYCFNDTQPIREPTHCPPGYYCLAGSTHYALNPCKIGTYNPSSGAFNSLSCLPCPQGKYCSSPGLQSPSGNCADGMVCYVGSTKPSGDTLCPPNYYCQQGVNYQCPLGTYSSPAGLSSKEQCIQCPSGSICPSQTTIQDCPQGYFCQGSLSAVSESNLCTLGHRCPSKTSIPLKCIPGSFQNLTGQRNCQACPEGFYCPLYAMKIPLRCEENMTCPEGSIRPKPCPFGTFADSQNQCRECPKGKYCMTMKGTNGIIGDCLPGYVCSGGSSSPRPWMNIDDLQPSQMQTYNGPALRGHFSVDGMNQFKCLQSTFQPSRWATNCTSCYAGSYCNQEGMISLIDKECLSGKLCVEGSESMIGSQACPSGSVVNQGESHCMFCEDGTIETQNTCIPCPDGFFCNRQSGQMICGVGKNCPLGTRFEPSCPEGSYLKDQACLPCTKGSYCKGGVIAGLCTSGYYCEEGNSLPAKRENSCPVNRYCLAGTTWPSICPDGYYRLQTGAIQVSDCVQCAAGQVCKFKESPYECPQGFYCPLGDTTPEPCPEGTWSQRTGIVAANECQVCPPGYLCNLTNSTDFSQYPCPRGSYCPLRALKAFNCPAGTYRDTDKGRGAFDCKVCPEGHYCTEGTWKPKRCSDGMYCPEGSQLFTTCPGGYFCNSDINFRIEVCPRNFYCPLGSSRPVPCTGRLICHEGSEIGEICEAGYYAEPQFDGRTTECLPCSQGEYSTIQENKCKPCKAGFLCYGKTNRENPTDFHNHHGEICPRGFYCPEGSSSAIPCPVGSYNPSRGAISEEQCLLCPINTFNDRLGASSCQACGVYAKSSEGSSTCECLGQFRAFSDSDSSCRCQSGYDYLDPLTSDSRGTESSDPDCMPLVHERCDFETQQRDIYGKCRDINDCSEQCVSGSKGARSQITGICSCEQDEPVDLICNQQCRRQAASMIISDETDYLGNLRNQVNITVDGQTVEIDLSEIAQTFGKFQCKATATTTCEVKAASVSSSGFLGYYGTSNMISHYVKRVLQGRRSLKVSEEEDRSGFPELFQAKKGDSAISELQNINLELQNLGQDQRFGYRSNNYTRDLQSQEVPQSQSISNPVFCISLGTTMLFTIEDPYHYPVYMKDSVLNSNPSFDYGQFLILKTEMQSRQTSNNSGSVLFAQTFNQAGAYVFADAQNMYKIMLVRVVDLGQQCADPDRYVQPLSSNSVSSTGIKINQDIIIKPDTPLLISLGITFIFYLATVMVGVGYCLHKGWPLKRIALDSYKKMQIALSISHTDDELYLKRNDFENFASSACSEEDRSDDDIDDINMDINLDLIKFGKEYLDTFDQKKLMRASQKEQKKRKAVKILSELEEMLSQIGSDALANQMVILELVQEGKSDSQILNDIDEAYNLKLKLAIDEEEREKARLEDEEQRRLKMIQDWNAEDREVLLRALDKMGNDLVALKRNMNTRGAKNQIQSKRRATLSGGELMIGETGEYALAIYDSGDVNSRHNQIVKEIMENSNLSEQEKEMLLRFHQANYLAIEELIRQDKRKHDLLIERTLKEKIERRRKFLIERFQHEIQLEQRVQVKRLKEEIEVRREKELQRVEIQSQMKLDALLAQMKEGQVPNYREKMEQIKLEQEKLNAQLHQSLEEEIEMMKIRVREEIIKRYSQEFRHDSQKLEELLKDLEGTRKEEYGLALEDIQREMEEALSQLKAASSQRDEQIKQMELEERKRIEKEVIESDPLQEEELQIKKQKVKDKHIQKGLELNESIKTEQDLSQEYISHQKYTQQNDDQIASIQQDIDKKCKHLNIIEHIPIDSQEQLILIQEDQAQKDEKLNMKRNQLKKRVLKQRLQDQELRRISVKIEHIAKDAEENNRIYQNYVASIFKKQAELCDMSTESENYQVNGQKAVEMVQQKLLLLNEFQSDAYLKRLQGSLLKQLFEKDQKLKLLLSKYTDAKVIEKGHIKDQFKLKKDQLEKLKNDKQLTDHQFEQAQRSLKLFEENMLREIDLQFDQAMREEEAQLKEQFEKQNAAELVKVKKIDSEAQIELKKELMLLGQEQLRQEQIELKESLRAFEQGKQREASKRVRLLGIQKQEIIKQIQRDIENKYSDFEDLLKKKREEELTMADKTLSIRLKLEERRRKIQELAAGQRLSQTDQQRMKDIYEKQLEALISVFDQEKERQQIKMQKMMLIRRDKQEKQLAQQELLDEMDIEALQKEMTQKEEFKLLRTTKNDQLLERLEQWRQAKRNQNLEADKCLVENSVLNIDPLIIKKFIIKLDNLERNLKDLQRLSKREAETKASKITNNLEVPQSQSKLSQYSHRKNAPQQHALDRSVVVYEEDKQDTCKASREQKQVSSILYDLESKEKVMQNRNQNFQNQNSQHSVANKIISTNPTRVAVQDLDAKEKCQKVKSSLGEKFLKKIGKIPSQQKTVKIKPNVPYLNTELIINVNEEIQEGISESFRQHPDSAKSATSVQNLFK